MRLGPMPQPMRRIVTSFGEAEFKKLQAYADKHKRAKTEPSSLYALAKAAIREYIDRHP